MSPAWWDLVVSLKCGLEVVYEFNEILARRSSTYDIRPRLLRVIYMSIMRRIASGNCQVVCDDRVRARWLADGSQPYLQ